ncbi:MAG: hypothetical protein ACI4QU_05250, partial [Christensenellales bacterium]
SNKLNSWLRLSLNGFTTVSNGGDFIGYEDAKEYGEDVFTDIPCVLAINKVSEEEIIKAAFSDIDKFYVYDVLGLYASSDGEVKKLFENGMTVTKKGITVGESENSFTMDVTATLSYKLPSDILTNPTKYFGTTAEIEVLISSEQCSITMPITVYYIDRTVKKIVDVNKRSVIFDPYIGIAEDALSDGPIDINVTDQKVITKVNAAGETSIEVSNVSDRVVTFGATWTSRDSILKIVKTERNGYEWPDNMVTITSDTNAVMQIRIPVYLINRTISEIRLNTEGQYDQLKYDEYRTTTQYSFSNDTTLDQMMTVTYDNKTSEISKVEFKNPYTYSADCYPTTVKVTFTDGQVISYNIVWSKVPEKADAVTSTKATARAYIVIGSVEKNVFTDEFVYDSESLIVVAEFDVNIVVKSFNVTRFNSDVASDTLDLNYNYEFYPYATTEGTTITLSDSSVKTVYNPYVDAKDANGKYTYYANELNAYLDGQWVRASYIANYIGYKALANNEAGYVTITSAEMPAGVITYRLDPITRRYESSGSGSFDYVYVYNVSFSLDISEWDLSGVNYTTNGGTTYASVKFGNEDIQTTYRTPIRIIQSTFDSFDWAQAAWTDGTTAQHNVFLNSVGAATGTSLFDPWSSTGYTTSSVDKYYPNTVAVKFTDGTNTWTQTVNVEWNFNNLEIDMTGGEGHTKVIIGADNAYDVSKYKFELKELSVVQIVNYIDRTIRFNMSSNTEIKAQTGFAGAKSYDEMIEYTGTITNVDPYTYTRPTMPTSLSVTSNGSTYSFTETSSSYKLVWDYSAFYPSYLGGETQITAQLTVPSGLKQEIKIKYYVYKMMINKLSSTGYTTDVNTETGKCATAFNITPFTASSYSLPTSYTVYFARQKYNGTSFETATTVSKSYNYVQVSMPSSFKYEFVSTDKTGYLASIKVGSQQRVNVDVVLKAWTTTPSYSASSGTRGYVVTKSGSYPIAYIGYAQVYNKAGTSVIATYNLTITSADTNYYLPKYSGNRKVVYTLLPIVGVMVDSSGRALTTEVLSSDLKIGTQVVAKAGDEIPYGKGGRGSSITVTSTN